MQKTITNSKTRHALINPIKRVRAFFVLVTFVLSSTVLFSQTQTFSYTGNTQTFVVPCGVSALTVDVRGAQGGGTTGANGGFGGRAQSVMPVTPGETLNIYVGGAGAYVSVTSPGGFNGGGGTTYNNGAAGTGGGASDIRRGTSLANRVVVAGGGGGGAASGGQNRIGGNGGGLTGMDGLAWNTYTNSGGKGGTQTAGGAAGVACCYTATAGSFGLGGDGKGDGAGGGGGGGGYYGGGGSVFGAGGGGSSYFDNSNTFTSTTTGFQSGDGFVSVTYTVSSPGASGVVSGATTICQGIATSYSVSAIPGASNYSWTVPTGAVINSGQGTNAISVTFGANTGTVMVTPSYSTTCPINSSSLSVAVNAAPNLTVNSGAVCSGQSFTIVPSGATAYSIQGGNAVVTPTGNSTYTVTGTSSAGCSSQSFVTSSVTVNSLPSVSVSVSANTICIGQSATLTANGANTYSWNTGASSNMIVATPTTNTSYNVVGTSSVTSCSGSASVSIVVSACTSVSQNSITKAISVFPNPTNGKLVIELNNNSVEEIEVYDYTGKKVLTSTANAGNALIDLGSFENGIYFVKIKDNKEAQVIKVIKQ